MYQDKYNIFFTASFTVPEMYSTVHDWSQSHHGGQHNQNVPDYIISLREMCGGMTSLTHFTRYNRGTV